MNEKINELFDSVRRYSTSEEFKELMDFCARFKHLAPYNAMLVNIQMPGVRYVLTSKEWSEKYHREVQINARPIMILIPFGPVQFVYDISQTKPGRGHMSKDEELLQKLMRPYEPMGGVAPTSFQNLVDSLSYDGIRTDFTMTAASSHAGYVCTKATREYLYYHYKKNTFRLEYEMPLLMSINKDASLEEKFCTICHELGHVLARHLYVEPFDWEPRRLSQYEEEFEAEAISWLVTQRFGITDSRSSEYLGQYYSQNKYIPAISIGTVLSAVTEIERRIRKPDLKQGLIYKYDKEFRKSFDDALAQMK